MRLTPYILASSILLLSACSGTDNSPETKPAPTQTNVEAPISVEAPEKPVVETVKIDTVKTPAVAYEFNQANGKKFYKKCIACHQASGDGIPGSFPALTSEIDSFTKTPEGRAYLVLVIKNGLRGTLSRADGDYKGIMVRQAGGKSEADIADLLNYMFETFYTDNSAAFTAAEVKAITDSHGRLNSAKVLALRPG